MRISDYPKKTDVTGGEYFVVDSVTDGTKAVEMNDIKKSAMDLVTNEEYYDFLDRIGIPWQQRRNIFRGKNLGSSYTAEQKARVADGSFKGFFIGDYWEKNGIKYRIVDINYWIGTGETECTTNHLVIVPDCGLGDPQKMNDTNTTQGGYGGSKMASTYIGPASGMLINMFGQSKLLTHSELVSNAVTNGYPSGGVWGNFIWILMNEPMVYGSYQITPASNGTVIPYRYTIDKTQLSLFKLHPEFIVAKNNGQRDSYWLRDVVSATSFARVTGHGNSYDSTASAALTVRPVVGVTG